MTIDSCPALAAAEAHSRETIASLAALVASIAAPWDYTTLFAIGSYGRLEARESTSDFEWLIVYDDGRVAHAEAEALQAAATARFAELLGRERLSVNKTFGRTVSFRDLGTNVGGLAETSRMLTYRMLTLTEGRPLSPGRGHDRLLDALANVYAGSHTAGHRLLSLASEVARYYRTIRVAYKFNIDEAGKPWAVRNLKTRVLRRMAFAGSALDFVAHGPRIDYGQAARFDPGEVSRFLRGMAAPPATRFHRACTDLGLAPRVFLPVLELYDSVLGALSDPEVRRRLDHLRPEHRHDDVDWDRLREQSARLLHRLADLVVQLPEEPRRQLLEMFLF
jgi:hypothetical protein